MCSCHDSWFASVPLLNVLRQAKCQFFGVSERALIHPTIYKTGRQLDQRTDQLYGVCSVGCVQFVDAGFAAIYAFELF